MEKTPGNRDAPVIVKFYELMVWTLGHTSRFPRHHRFSLGVKIEATQFEVLDHLIEARYSSRKEDLLIRVNVLLERLRFQMRLAKDLKVLSLGSYEYQARALEEIGRMIGGWRKSVSLRTPKGPS